MKSRQERVGSFTPGEVAGWVCDLVDKYTIMAGAMPRIQLVLERTVTGVATLGWNDTLSALPINDPLSIAVNREAAKRQWPSDRLAEACSITGVFVLPWEIARRESECAVGGRLRLLPAAASPVVRALREAVAGVEDVNTSPDYSCRSSLDRTRINQVVEETRAVLDQSGLQEALRSGACEAVDFSTPLVDKRFFEGVAVQPGHIAAGLPTPRPELAGAVLRGLESGNSVLVTGPSGAGKSAVMWSAAYSCRNVEWYRVRRLNLTDIAALVRFAHACLPAEHAPVGFIVDGVGIGATQAWDELCRELAAVPHVLLLGSIRVEDLATLLTLSDTSLVEVGLDERLAEQIHAGLTAGETRPVMNWQEAFHLSRGLTMEFTHLVTRGRRLREVIDEQVQRRVLDERDGELDVLRLVSTADRWSSTISLASAQAGAGLSASMMRRALHRLRDEHLVVNHDGVLKGLHQLRSTTLSQSIHTNPPPTLVDTFGELLPLIEDAAVLPVVRGAFTDLPDHHEALLSVLVPWLRNSTSPSAWTGALQALRLVDFQKIADHWARVMSEHRVAPARESVTVNLALLDKNYGLDFRHEITAALEAMRELDPDSVPLRDRALSLLGPVPVGRAIASCESSVALTRLLAVLARLPKSLADVAVGRFEDEPVAQILKTLSVPELAEVLLVARDSSIAVAEALATVAAIGTSLAQRLLDHDPLVYAVEARYDDPDGPLAYARAITGASDARDPDALAKELARTVVAFYPRTIHADVRVEVPGRQGIRIGEHESGMSLLQRSYALPGTEVAWNRLRMHMAVAAGGTEDARHRLTVARTLLKETSGYLQLLIQAWCIARLRASDLKTLDSQRERLIAAADQLRIPLRQLDPQSFDGQTPDPIPTDHLHTLVDGIAGSLTSRLFTTLNDASGRSSLAAYCGGTLLGALSRTTDEEPWKLDGLGAPAELGTISCMLRDLHAVLAEMSWGAFAPDDISALARSGSYAQALSRVAGHARATASRRHQDVLDSITAAAHEKGIALQTHSRRLNEPAATDWPPVEVALTIAVQDLAEWLSVVELVLDLARTLHGIGSPSTLIIPSIGDCTLRQCAINQINSTFPGQELFDSWNGLLPQPAETPIADLVVQCHQSLQELSSAQELIRARQRSHPVLVERISQLGSRANEMVVQLARGSEIAVVGELASSLRQLLDDVNAEPHAASGAPTYAAEVAAGLAGRATASFQLLTFQTIIALQADFDPAAAARMLADFASK